MDPNGQHATGRRDIITTPIKAPFVFGVCTRIYICSLADFAPSAVEWSVGRRDVIASDMMMNARHTHTKFSFTIIECRPTIKFVCAIHLLLYVWRANKDPGKMPDGSDCGGGAV